MISFIIVSFVLVINIFCFNKFFYHYEFNDLAIAKDIGISEKELNEVTDILLDYTQNKRDNLDYKVNINHQSQEFFTAKDKAHMQDVQALYINVRRVGILAFITLIISLIVIWRDNDKYFYLFNAYHQLLLCLTLLIAIALFNILADFNNFWIIFHKIIFKNDLWLLSPEESNLIKMVPEQLFNHLVLLICIGYSCLLIANYILLSKIRKRVFIND